MSKNKTTVKITTAAMLVALAACCCLFTACGGSTNGEVGMVRFECEYSEWGASNDGVELMAEGNAAASGGSCVAYFRAGSTLTFKIISDKAEDGVIINVCGSSCVEMRNGSDLVGIRAVSGEIMSYMLSVNGVPTQNWSGKFIGSGAGDELGAIPVPDFYNWSVVSSKISLREGENIIVIKGNGSALNWDYIELVTSRAAIYWQPDDIFEF